MVRTKHLFVLGTFLVLATSTVSAGTLVLNGFQVVPAEHLEASVVLGVPAESYSISEVEEEADTRADFIEKIKNTYVPPPVTQDPVTEESMDSESSFVHTPEPTPLPVAVIEESLTVRAAATSSEEASLIPVEHATGTASSTEL